MGFALNEDFEPPYDFTREAAEAALAGPLDRQGTVVLRPRRVES